jgi:hypothetical protein
METLFPVNPSTTDDFKELIELYLKDKHDFRVHYKIIKFVEKHFDTSELDRLKEKYFIDDATIRTTKDCEKYFKRKYIIIKLEHIIRLGLHRKERCNVLDLGSGFGWFSLLCKLLGHTPYCIDAHPPISAEFYHESIELFGLKRQLHTILPFQPLPDMPMKFDVVVALQVCFNLYKKHYDWGVGEWAYLIYDLEKRCCNKDFVFYIEFNLHSTDRHHGLHYSDILKQWLEENNFKFYNNNKIVIYQSSDNKAPMQPWFEKYEQARICLNE